MRDATRAATGWRLGGLTLSRRDTPADTAGARSRDLFERALRALPGGVSSPVRAFRAVGGTPRFVASASGATVVDEDGRSYLDFVGSWGPLILGHAHPEVVEAVRDAAGRGLTYGAPCRAELALAEKVIASYPGAEQTRFVSSGTEATMTAVRLARGVTGRDLLVKFAGCYHGHADSLLVAAGSGLATFGTPSSAGVPEAVAGLTRVLPLDDEEAATDLFTRDGNRIAAVILEPVPANHGLLLQRREWLETLRRLTAAAGALLIFDEVISGFRLGPGGAATLFGVTPDLATFGKVIGGGMPVGAIAGRRELMRHLAPEGRVYQAGTLSGNPLAMAAGLATLQVLEREDGWSRLEQLGIDLERRLAPVLAAAPFPARLVRLGSIFWICLQDTAPRSAEAVAPDAGERYRPLFHALLERGISLAPSAFEVGFLSTAHSEQDVERLAGALGATLAARD
jgi:glutamate-1-semialdehyde 2,1-aminomutase